MLPVFSLSARIRELKLGTTGAAMATAWSKVGTTMVGTTAGITTDGMTTVGTTTDGSTIEAHGITAATGDTTTTMVGIRIRGAITGDNIDLDSHGSNSRSLSA